jgi:dTDP-4-amino-4,6-dideoxygalactose transaminase
MKKNNIEVGRHYFPNHLLNKFKAKKLKIVEHVAKKIITLPIHGDLTLDEQLKVVKCLKNFYR